MDITTAIFVDRAKVLEAWNETILVKKMETDRWVYLQKVHSHIFFEGSAS